MSNRQLDLGFPDSEQYRAYNNKVDNTVKKQLVNLMWGIE